MKKTTLVVALLLCAVLCFVAACEVAPSEPTDCNVTYTCNIPEAITDKAFTFKSDAESVEIPVTLASAYSKSTLVVTYKVGDGEVQTATLANGKFTVANPAADIAVNVTGAELNTYTVTVKLGDETKTTFTVNHGAKISAEQLAAAEQAVVQVGYEFVKWTEDVTAGIVADMVIHAEVRKQTAKVTFVNGTLQHVVSVEYGQKLSAAQIAEAKAAVVAEGYHFVSFDVADLEDKVIEANLTVNVTAAINTYTVTIKLGDEVKKTFQDIQHGSKLTAAQIAEAKAAVEAEGYHFVSWDVADIANTAIVADTTITATTAINTYKVMFKFDGSVVKEYTLNHGATLTSQQIEDAQDAAIESIDVENYRFDGWDVDDLATKAVTEDITVNVKTRARATYTATIVTDVDNALSSEMETEIQVRENDNLAFALEFAEAYTQNVGKVTVSYTMGSQNGEIAYENDGYKLVNVTANVTVRVSGIQKNKYKVVLYKDEDKVFEQDVEHGSDVPQIDTPATDTKRVFEGYTYQNIEQWVSQQNGMQVVDLTNVTTELTAYYKHDVIVYNGMAYYDPSGGYKTIMSANRYVKGNADGSIEFKVSINSLATDGNKDHGEQNQKTSFVIYGKQSYGEGWELSTGLPADSLNKWFTVKVTAEGNATIYKPDGTVAAQKQLSEYSAETISIAVHADAKIAAVNPEIAEIARVTYLDEDGETEIATEEVVKGGAATYKHEVTKADENLGDGYTKKYDTVKWFDVTSGAEVDLSTVQGDITVKLGYGTLVVGATTTISENTAITSLNRFIDVDSDGMIVFKVRISDSTWTSLWVVTSCGYVGVGVETFPTWLTVTINTSTGDISIEKADGTFYDLDMSNYTLRPTTLSSVLIKAENCKVQVAAVDADVVDMQYFDTDKTTLLTNALTLRSKMDSGYVHQFEADADGYVKTIDTWAPISEDDIYKVYAVSGTYKTRLEVSGSSTGDICNNKLSIVLKHVEMKDNKYELYFVPLQNQMRIGLVNTSWEGLVSYVSVNKTYKAVVDFSEPSAVVGTLYEDGVVIAEKVIENITSDNLILNIKTAMDWTSNKNAESGSIDVAIRW